MTPFPEADIADRVAKAETSLKDYFENRESPTLDMATTALVDLLADLRHWADAKGLDFGDADRIAYQHYLEEKRG